MTLGVEVATLVMSVVSLVGAGFALWRTHRVERRSLLLENHRQFIDPDSSTNRAELHSAFDSHGPEWYLHVDKPTQVRINSGLAQLDAMAYQVTREYVPKADAEELWGPAMAGCFLKAEPFILHRRMNGTANLWTFLEQVVQQLDQEILATARGEASRSEGSA
ncbi:MAG: hypothetical protein WCF36_03540 [Candidatus Nanopelagicales bacterium]